MFCESPVSFTRVKCGQRLTKNWVIRQRRSLLRPSIDWRNTVKLVGCASLRRHADPQTDQIA